MKTLRFTVCAQVACDGFALVSLVWPGKGRTAYCPTHARRAIEILQYMGLAAESLDIQPIQPDDGGAR